jgi:hypothetical protein
MLTIRKELVLAQIKNAHWVLEQIEADLTSNGFPGEDFDCEESEKDAYYTRLTCELSTVAQMCETLSTMLIG